MNKINERRVGAQGNMLKIQNKNTYTPPSVKSHTKKQIKVTGTIRKILSIARVPPLTRQRE